MRVLWIPPGKRPLFPEPESLHPDAQGLVALGGDIAPDALVEAYSKGIFPWDGNFPHPWFSPRRRALLDPRRFHVSHTLKRLARAGKYRVVFDEYFTEIMTECMSIPRPGQTGTWISQNMIDSYSTLFRQGMGFCAATLDESSRLVGGLYGVRLGKAYFGESMFSRERDASKLALMALCEKLAIEGVPWIDCQQDTAHLRSLGSYTVSRQEFLKMLRDLVPRPPG